MVYKAVLLALGCTLSLRVNGLLRGIRQGTRLQQIGQKSQGKQKQSDESKQGSDVATSPSKAASHARTASNSNSTLPGVGLSPQLSALLKRCDESKVIGASVYNMSFCLLVGILYFTSNPSAYSNATVIIRSILVLICFGSSVCLLLIPKFYAIHFGSTLGAVTKKSDAAQSAQLPKSPSNANRPMSPSNDAAALANRAAEDTRSARPTTPMKGFRAGGHLDSEHRKASADTPQLVSPAALSVRLRARREDSVSGVVSASASAQSAAVLLAVAMPAEEQQPNNAVTEQNARKGSVSEVHNAITSVEN